MCATSETPTEHQGHQPILKVPSLTTCWSAFSENQPQPIQCCHSHQFLRWLMYSPALLVLSSCSCCCQPGPASCWCSCYTSPAPLLYCSTSSMYLPCSSCVGPVLVYFSSLEMLQELTTAGLLICTRLSATTSFVKIRHPKRKTTVMFFDIMVRMEFGLAKRQWTTKCSTKPLPRKLVRPWPFLRNWWEQFLNKSTGALNDTFWDHSRQNMQTMVVYPFEGHLGFRRFRLFIRI